MHGNLKDLTDKKFGRLEVKEFAYVKNKRTYWRCVCDCGEKKTIAGGHLKTGHTKSCGCLKKDGHRQTEESKRRLSEAHKGKKLSAEHVLNMSKANIGKRTGKDGSRWNSKLTVEDRMERRLIPGYKEWVQLVYELDNHTCQKCGDDTGGNLNAHHIESYRSNPELRTEISNGITLCEDCHKDFHHQYGYGDNTRAQLVEFLK